MNCLNQILHIFHFTANNLLLVFDVLHFWDLIQQRYEIQMKDVLSNLLLFSLLSTSSPPLSKIIEIMESIELPSFQNHIFLILILFGESLLLNLMLNNPLFLKLHLYYNRFSIYSTLMGSQRGAHQLLNLYFMCFGMLF